MAFVDNVVVKVKAGKGGSGKLSFRHEKFIAKGGPDGGDGGNGGDVILMASRNQNTLASFRYQKELHAEDGHSGENKKKHGRNGLDLIVKVPIGTVAATISGQIIADLTNDEMTAVIASGGKGGFGNAHFVSSRRQAPNFAEKGEPGDKLDVKLELKMIADVGLVGLPNVGKSTLLAKISNARPEIADYPFTTLTPNLGVVDVDKTSSLLFADIPGLIEGAAEGKGLGHDFLRHIERTAVILHIIDAFQDNVAAIYQTVRQELASYQVDLTKRPEIVALNKVEGLDEDIINDLVRQLKQVVPPKTPIVCISAASGDGLKAMLYEVDRLVKLGRQKAAKRQQAPKLKVISLTDDSGKWRVKRIKGGYQINGTRIEQFATRTDFNNEEAVNRLKDIMRRQGIMHELDRRGLKPGKVIQFGEDANQSYIY